MTPQALCRCSIEVRAGVISPKTTARHPESAELKSSGGSLFSARCLQLISKRIQIANFSRSIRVQYSTFGFSSGMGRASREWWITRPAEGGDAMTSAPRSRSQFSWDKRSACGLHEIRATLSSFANADEEGLDGKLQAEFLGEKDAKFYMDNVVLVEKEDFQEGESGKAGTDTNGGMAEAFHISSTTALVITAGIAMAALVLPFFMNSLATGMNLQTKALSYLTLLFGFYMAWNIGANDVANAMGTSVGSGALTLRQAVLTAAVLEFSGAFLVGSHVSHTMQKGILTAEFFNGNSSLIFSGMLSSLAAAGTWLQIASYYGLPVSTTHCIVGAMVGFGLAYGGFGAIYWSSLTRVVASWVVSPVIGATVSFVVYKCIRMFVYSAPNPGQAAATLAPIAVFIGFSAFSFTTFPITGTPFMIIGRALLCGLIGAVTIHFMIQGQLGNLLGDFCTVPLDVKEKNGGILKFLRTPDGPTGVQLKVVYGVFGYLQVLSACLMSFAHGASDVSNAIGPISAALAVLQGTGLGAEVVMPTEVLAWGGFGIVAGLTVWGYRVIATIGKKITELTPTRGFAAEFAAATVVLMASRIGLPISATHTLVGAVMGVGYARGLKSVRVETVRGIVASWMVTIPVGACLSIVYTLILSRLISVLI